MRTEDLSLTELLEVGPEGGVLHFAGQRTLLFDAGAWGLLRGELIQRFGMAGARGTLTRFGFAHGLRTAQAMRTQFPWDDEGQWKRAGARLHQLQGLLNFEPVAPRPGETAPFAEGLWHDSCEAEQHLSVLGRADEAVCWTLCGFASGYLSFCNGREIFCVEERCVGRGDPVCHVVGRFREEWGARAAEIEPFFKNDCLEKALRGLTEELKQTEARLRTKRQKLARAERREEPAGLVARSEAMARVLDLSLRAAKTDATVLLSGESGSGKERIARLIHDRSARAQGPFVGLNCGAVSESLLEAELFGHARGAFTGAVHERPGLFEAANGGTLLLDEVAELTPSMQVKLLRVLQEKEVRRVGENRTRPLNVRLLAATHKSLSDEVAAGRFRQDLLYRLKVIELRVPPLRERRDDVLPLARVLLEEACARVGRKLSGISPEAADQLLRHPWPGNVRELSNALERAVALGRGSRVELEDLPEEVRQALPATFTGATPRSLEQVEREYILAVLARNEGNRAKTAVELDIGPATLFRKLKGWGEAPRRRS